MWMCECEISSWIVIESEKRCIFGIYFVLWIIIQIEYNTDVI
jgi:hypothetical protein